MEEHLITFCVDWHRPDQPVDQIVVKVFRVGVRELEVTRTVRHDEHELMLLFGRLDLVLRVQHNVELVEHAVNGLRYELVTVLHQPQSLDSVCCFLAPGVGVPQVIQRRQEH